MACQFPEFGPDTGFSLEISPDERLQGRHVLQVVARSRRGRVARARQDVEIQFRSPRFETTPRRLPDARALTRFLAGASRLDFAAPDPVVSVVVVLHNRAELTLACLRSLQGTGMPLQLIVVDNASSDRTAALLQRIDGATVVRNAGNEYFLRAANQGARARREASTCSFSTTTPRSRPGAWRLPCHGLRTMARSARSGAAGALWRMSAGSGGHHLAQRRLVGYGRGDAPDAPPYMFERDVDYCAGAFLMTPRALFETLGGLDEHLAPGYYEDADYCLRVWEHGRRVVFEPRVKVWHVEHGSGTRPEVERAIARNHGRFYERHRARLSGHAIVETGATGRARVHGTPPHVLVVADAIPVVDVVPANERLRGRLRALQAAGYVVTLHPLSDGRASWDDVYRALPATVEVMNGYGCAFLGALLDDRAGDCEAIVLATSSEAAASIVATHVCAGKVIFDAWTAGIDAPPGMRSLCDLRATLRARARFQPAARRLRRLAAAVRGACRERDAGDRQWRARVAGAAADSCPRRSRSRPG